MIPKPPKYAYILGVIFGLLAFVFPAMFPISFPLALAIVYLILGGIFGFIWPKESWRWGLWIVGPMIVLLSLSVLFAGQMDVFFKKDLPLLLLGLTAASLGSYISSWYKRR